MGEEKRSKGRQPGWRKADRKPHHVGTRISDADLALLQKAIELTGKSEADIFRDGLLNELERILRLKEKPHVADQ